MPAKIPQDVREKQLRKLAHADGYTFVGWVGDYQNAHTKLIMNCSTHGDWVTSCNGFIDAKSRCNGCSGRKIISQTERELVISDLARADGYEFIGWFGEFQNGKSKMTIRCESHGDWVTTVGNFVSHGNRCSACAGNRLITQTEREDQFIKAADKSGYEFVGWLDGHNNGWSRAIISCPEHGEWVTNSINFISGGKGCMSCAVTGYRPTLPGTLYALLSDCGTMVKIGISNVPDKRHVELQYDTPFKFTVYRQLHCDDGSIPPMLEREFHAAFKGVGLYNFDGATEWRHMSEDVTTWFDLMSAQ